MAQNDRSSNMAQPCAVDESALVTAAKGGDVAAFTQLMERHVDRIYRLALRILEDESDAEDAAQEIFLRAHRGLANFHETAGFGSWLYRIAMNFCRDQLRRRAVQARMVGIVYTAHLWADERYTVNPERIVLAMETRGALDHALAALPAIYRLTVLLHDADGLPIRDVALVTGAPLATAKSRLRRARAALVTLLDEDARRERQDLACGCQGPTLPQESGGTV